MLYGATLFRVEPFEMGEGHRSRIDGAERTANHDSRFVRNCLVLTRARTRARLVDPELQLHGRADTHFARVGIGNCPSGIFGGKEEVYLGSIKIKSIVSCQIALSGGPDPGPLRR